MKKPRRLLVPIILLVFVSPVFFSSFKPDKKTSVSSLVIQQDTGRWIAPESANALVNPIEMDEDTRLDGEDIYKKNCRSCHGKLGDGKGAGAGDLSKVPTDFTNPEFLEQTDGSMFWKIKEGRGEMESYSKKLTEEEIWLAVLYIKTFAGSD